MPTLKGTEVSLSYVHFLYLIRSSRNVSIFHSTWLDSFWTGLVYVTCFLIYLATLCLLIRAFNPFTFKMITDRCVAVAILLFIFIFLFLFSYFLKIFYLFIFRQRGRKGERGGETSMFGCLLHAPHQGTWPTTQACALTGNQTNDPLVCRPALNPLSHTSRDLFFLFLKKSL